MSEILHVTGNSVDDPDAFMCYPMLNMKYALIPVILRVRSSYVDVSTAYCDKKS